MSLNAMLQALESVQNYQITSKINNFNFKYLPMFMSILGYNLHKNYEFTKRIYNQNKRYCNGLENQFRNDYIKYNESIEEISYENYIKLYINDSIKDFEPSINRYMYLKILNLLNKG